MIATVIEHYQWPSQTVYKEKLQLFVSGVAVATGGKKSKQRCPSRLMLFCITARMTSV